MHNKSTQSRNTVKKQEVSKKAHALFSKFERDVYYRKRAYKYTAYMATITVHIPTPNLHDINKTMAHSDNLNTNNVSKNTLDQLHDSSYSWDIIPDHVDSESITWEMTQHCNESTADIKWSFIESQLKAVISCRYLIYKQVIPYKNFIITRDYITMYCGRNKWNRIVATYIYAMENSPYPFNIDARYEQ